jgi:hypothetical protein
MSGLRNVAVFGVATTQALQGLRSAVGEEAFNEWYAPRREAMRQDELMRYFWDFRVAVLHKGRPGQTLPSVSLKNPNLAEIKKNPPPGAVEFVIADFFGGTGWEIKLPNGKREMYYVTVPEIEVKLHVPDPPTTHKGGVLDDTSIGTLAQHYVAYLRELVREAAEEFIP